jgi:hypothetical protein
LAQKSKSLKAVVIVMIDDGVFFYSDGMDTFGNTGTLRIPL